MTVFILLSPPSTPASTTYLIKQQPSGNMDDSGYFSIQVSSHKQALSAFYVPGAV